MTRELIVRVHKNSGCQKFTRPHGIEQDVKAKVQEFPLASCWLHGCIVESSRDSLGIFGVPYCTGAGVYT
jgi:hypothetical protein